MMRRRHRFIGFTLIELLVVVSVIGVLCAILVPALSHARARARKVACGATLHGLTVGMKAYLTQYSERYPQAAQMPSVNTDRPALPVALASEVSAIGGNDTGRAWRCVGDTLGYVRSSDNQSFSSYYAGETLSYEYNMSLGGKKLEQNMLYPLLGTTGMVVMADFDAFHGPKGKDASKNLLFADGHVGGVDDIAAGK